MAKYTQFKTDTVTFKSPFREGRTWYTRVVNRAEKGKPRRKRLVAQTKTEAIAEVRELFIEHLAAEKTSGARTKPTECLLREAMPEWLANTLSASVTPAHRYNRELLVGARTCNGEPVYGKFISELEALGCEYVREVEYKHVQKLVSGWGLQGRTMALYVKLLRAFFSWAVSMGYTPASPMEHYFEHQGSFVKKWTSEAQRATKTRGIGLSYEQCQQLLAACREPWTVTIEREGYRDGVWEQTYTPGADLYSAVLLALRTGLRAGNIVGLRWRHLKLDKGTVKIPAAETKTGKKTLEDFEAPLHDEVWAHLRELYRARGEPPNHTRVLPGLARQFRLVFYRALKRAGLGYKMNRKGEPDTAAGMQFRVHDLRHTAGRLIGAETSDAVRHQLMGHAPVDVDGDYCEHVAEATVRAQLNRLPWFFPRAAEAVRRVD